MTETKDLYRDTPVRYLGYANEVGESFRSIIGKRWVNATYGIATLYVLADTSQKGIDAFKAYANETDCKARVAFTTADTLIWQLLASVAIPGFTINRVCTAANYVLKKSTNLPKNTRKLTVTAVGLCAIPFIIKPIDQCVDLLLDQTLRKLKPQ